MHRKIPFWAVLLGLVSLPAMADEALLVFEVGTTPSYKAPATSVAPGKTILLDAGYFEVGDGTAVPQPLPDPEGSFAWHVQCPANSKNPCAPDAFTPSGHARSFQVPSDFRQIKIEVTHADQDGPGAERDSGLIVLKNSELAPKSETDKAALQGSDNSSLAPAPEEEEPAPTTLKKSRYRGRHPREDDYSESGSSSSYSGGRGRSSGNTGASSEPVHNYSGGGGGGGSGARSSWRSRARSRHDYDNDSYYSGYSGGGSTGPNTTARGYNRDGEVDVVSCSPQIGADGKLHISCEDPSKKELRVRAPEPAKAPLAVKKKAKED
ncbi:MAG: hypothetical protein ACXWSD_20850, partial [Bdellovibrionota bacterium]